MFFAGKLDKNLIIFCRFLESFFTCCLYLNIVVFIEVKIYWPRQQNWMFWKKKICSISGTVLLQSRWRYFPSMCLGSVISFQIFRQNFVASCFISERADVFLQFIYRWNGFPSTGWLRNCGSFLKYQTLGSRTRNTFIWHHQPLQLLGSRIKY